MKSIVYKILAIFTKLYIARTKPYVIGITWSVGKTSCRMIVTQVLQKYLLSEKIYTSPKNFNSEMWVMFSIFQIESFTPSFWAYIKVIFQIIFQSVFAGKKYDILVLEYGIDHPWDMDFLVNMVQPELSIFTRLDSIHSENFSSKADIWEEKFKLILATHGKTYFNYADDFLREKHSSVKIDLKYFNEWNLESKFIIKNDSIWSELHFWNRKVQTNILWDENYAYIELAYLILWDFHVTEFKDEEYVELKNQPGRFTIFEWINESILVDSTYNAWFESMKQMIENTIKLRDEMFVGYKIWYVVWDMRELWKEAEKEHIKLYNEIKSGDLVISIWQETKSYFPWDVTNYASPIDAGKHVRRVLEGYDDKYIILFKWSQNTIFAEEALKQVLANKEDEKFLVRQDENWMKQKQIYLI